jgi:hypothetical protein
METCSGMPSTAFRPPPSQSRFFFLLDVYRFDFVFGLILDSLNKDSPGTVPNVSNCCLFVCLVPAASSSKLEVRGCSLPPEIANGRYQILPMRRSFSSSSFSPLSSRIQHWNNLQMSSNGSSTPTTSPVVVVPVYSSALYSCYRGFLSGGSSLISCSPGGWWQPTHNAPRCLPFGSSSSASSGGIHHSHGTYPHRRRTFFFFFRFFSYSRLAENGPHNNGHFGNEFRIDAGFWVRRSSDVALIHRPKSPPFFFFQNSFLFFPDVLLFEWVGYYCVAKNLTAA